MIDEFRDNPLKGIKNKWNGKKQMDVAKANMSGGEKMLKQISADVDGATLQHISARFTWLQSWLVWKQRQKQSRKEKKTHTNLWNMPSPTFLSLSIFVKVPILMVSLFQFTAIAFLFRPLFFHPYFHFRLPLRPFLSAFDPSNFSLLLI